VGHGSHTASTAAGSQVNDVSFNGLAKGTARGGVPSSRIAVYKVCATNVKCISDSILAAFVDAIADGVDIISISAGPARAPDFLQDIIAIGSFHAMEKGILTTHSVGNDGPTPSSVLSGAPWLVSVAATTIDRQFIDKLVLGNGKTFIGKSVNTFPSNGTKFPIVHSCPARGMYDCIDKNMMNGKLVLCGQLGDEVIPYENGAIGSIINGTKSNLEAPSVTPKPSIYLGSNEFVHVQSYTNSTIYPVAEILKSEIFHDNNAPRIVDFSSRGPNPVIPEIMKPDISAPGVDILAAWSPLGLPSEDYGNSDRRHAKYNIESGTSMSCPHVAGVAAYVKSFHPNWSPAAIKSAIMTTAIPVKGPYDDLAGEFAYGSGNINPQQALNPGLIYDITKEDYVQMLCNYGYDTNKIRQISGDDSSCHGASKRSLVKDINYPAMVFLVHRHFNVKIHRTVTNVGFHNSTYKATLIHHNPKVKISVEPKILSFKSLNEKQSFVVTVFGEAKSNQTVCSSSLVWSDETHNVKSPIIVQRIS
jgi:subtilisin family serine protease